MPVEFDQENSFNKTFNNNFSKTRDSKMNAFLIKHNFARNEKQASMILFGVSVVFFVLTIFVFSTFVFGNNISVNKASPETTKAIETYKTQGLTGRALMNKMQEDRKNGILK